MSDSLINKYWNKFRRAFGFRDPKTVPDGVSTDTSEADRRRETRFDLPEGEPLSLRLEFNSEFCEIVNLSTQGLAFRAPDSFSLEQIGSEVQTVICVENAVFPVSLQPRHCLEGIVGCRVAKATSDWQKAAEQYIEPLRAGHALREIHPEFLRREDDGFQIRWFQGLAGCDLFVWSGVEDEVRRVQLFYYSAIVEWTEAHGLRTGRLQEDIGFEKRLVTIEADIYGFSSVLDEVLLSKAQCILAASSVPPEIQAYFQKPSS